MQKLKLRPELQLQRRLLKRPVRHTVGRWLPRSTLVEARGNMVTMYAGLDGVEKRP